MADKKPEAVDTPPKKKPKLLLFIIIGALLVVLAGGAATFFLLKQEPLTDEDGEEVAPKVEKAKKPKRDRDAPPVFVKLEPFTVKLQVEQHDTYLQATLELRVFDAVVGERVKQYIPELRHQVLMVLAGKKASELATPQGVQRLSHELRAEINLIIDGPKRRARGPKDDAQVDVIEPADPDDSVQAVLFTSFIVQ
jgi:flagellar protein FliL